MPPQPADHRLGRLLALVPWVAARDGVDLSEVCERFDYDQQQLVDDLHLLFMCGLHPYTPDTLIDVDIADGQVWIRYADYFRRPLALTPSEGLALLVAGKTLLGEYPADPRGPLARGLDKLSAALGPGGGRAVDVELAPVAEEILATLRHAREQSRALSLDYYSFGTDRWSRRVVEPYEVFNASGQWYLSAYCREAGDDRLFRVDRIRTAEVLAETVLARTTEGAKSVFDPSPEDPRVTIEVGEEGRWIAEQYPVDAVRESEPGRWQVTLAAGRRAWLERLLLRLGPGATVVAGEDPRAAAAERVLARYEQGDG